MKKLLFSIVALCGVGQALAIQLYSNGTYITGTNTNGDQISEALAYGTLPDGSPNSLAGFNFDKDENGALGDDFNVPAGQTWSLTSMKVYGYQTLGTPSTNSTFTGAYVRIYNGDPSSGGTLVAGDETTNRLQSSTFSNVYRVFNGSANPSYLTNRQRAVMENVIDMSWAPQLPSGHYFVVVSATGTSTSGPWWVPTTELANNNGILEFQSAFSQLSETQYNLGVPNGGRPRDLMFTLDGTSTGNAITVNPSSFTLSPGLVVSGTLSDLFLSDDNKLVLRPGIIFSTSQRPISMVLEGTAPGSTASSLQFVIESSANQGSLNERVEVFNFTTATYDAPISSVTLTTTDTVRILGISNPNQHIGPGNLLRVRVSYAATAPVFSYPWLIRIDEGTWRFAP